MKVLDGAHAKLTIFVVLTNIYRIRGAAALLQPSERSETRAAKDSRPCQTLMLGYSIDVPQDDR